MDINTKNINAIKMLGIQAINKANSGHPGIVLGAAPIIYALFKDHLNVNVDDELWINRDRFVLSAGHGSALLYATMHLFGYKDISIQQLKKFRQIDSKTPGHPEFGHTNGVDATTGPLGQGFAMAVGMAIAESHLNSKYSDIIDHYTYVLCGDGDLQEGIVSESISLAGKLNLNKLIVLHDSNDIQLDSKVNIVQCENIQEKFRAANWNTVLIDDGNNWQEISNAIDLAKKSNKPTYIEIKTIIGKDATNQGTQKVHGAPLGKDIKVVQKALEWDNLDFAISNDIYKSFNEIIESKKQNYQEWKNRYNNFKKNNFEEFTKLNNAINKNWKITLSDIKKLTKDVTNQATRVSSGNVLNYLTQNIEHMIGGSADLSESTKVKGADGIFSKDLRTGRNLMYGVREFAMGAINNGIALHGGLLPFCSGFFVFSDYMKPAIRMSALQRLQTLYIFTHDSIAVGEDGPTHQPIEQLAMLRSIPNIYTFRPADMHETIGAYLFALKTIDAPTSIIVSRQNLIELKHNTNYLDDISKGAYIIENAKKTPKVTLIATGSEVSLALEIKKILEKNKIWTTVISMPCQQLFDQQEQAYKNKIINKKTTRYSIELATTFGWDKYLGDEGRAFGLHQFGYSAPIDQIIGKIKFNVETIAKEIIKKEKKVKKVK